MSEAQLRRRIWSIKRIDKMQDFIIVSFHRCVLLRTFMHGMPAEDTPVKL